MENELNYDACKSLPYINNAQYSGYLIIPSNEAITNEEHFKYDIEQLVRHFCSILTKQEMKQYCIDVIDSIN